MQRQKTTASPTFSGSGLPAKIVGEWLRNSLAILARKRKPGSLAAGNPELIDM